MATTLATTPTEATQKRIGNYRLLRQVEVGPPGTIYAAEETGTHRHVAVRLLPVDAARRPAFIEAARKLMRLEHPHLAEIVDAGETDSDCYLVTALPKGETLHDRLKREHRLPPKESLRIAREMAAGLAFAHEHGLVHRELCPANVWLDGAGRARLLGLGSHVNGKAGSLLGRFDETGSPGYLSPEQAAGEEIAPASDLFSLGTILYQMTTGERPFRGVNSTALVRAVVFDHPSAARQVNPEVPDTVDALITRLLAKLPADRPASAREVCDRLTEWLDPVRPTKPNEPIVYPASQRILQSLEALKSPAAAQAEIPFAAELPPRRNRWSDLLAAVLLIAGAVGLYLWWRASNDKPAPPPEVQNEANR